MDNFSTFESCHYLKNDVVKVFEILKIVVLSTQQDIIQILVI